MKLRWADWDYLGVPLDVYTKVRVMVLNMELVSECRQKTCRAQLFRGWMLSKDLLRNLHRQNLSLLNESQGVLNLFLS